MMTQASAIDVDGVIDNVRKQIGSSTLRNQWSQPVVALASRVQRTYLSKSEFRRLLRALGVDLGAADRRILWKAMVDGLSSKVPLDVFVNRCIVQTHSSPGNTSFRRASSERSLEDVSRTLFSFIRDRAVTELRRRLAFFGREPVVVGPRGYDLHKAFVAVFGGDFGSNGGELFVMRDLDEALQLCGYRGSLQLSFDEVYRVFREMDSGRRGYVDFHSFSDWFIQQEREKGGIEEGTDKACGSESEAGTCIWEEPCWRRLEKKAKAAKDAALQGIVLDHMRRCQDEGRFNNLIPDAGKVGFLQILHRCNVKDKTEEIEKALRRLLHVDCNENVSWQRWKDVLNTRSMFIPDNLERNPVALSHPEKKLSALIFQSNEEALRAGVGPQKDNPCAFVKDFDQNDECPCWRIDNQANDFEEDSLDSVSTGASNVETLDEYTSSTSGREPEPTLSDSHHEDADEVEDVHLTPEPCSRIELPGPIEEESKEELDKEPGPVTRNRLVEVVGVCIRRNDGGKPPNAVLQCTLMPWGITSSFSAQSEKGVWSCWSDSRGSCVSMGASMRMKYPMEQVPVLLNPSISNVSIEGRVQKNRPHVLVKVFNSRPNHLPFARGRRLRLIGQRRINLGVYLNGGRTVKNAVETIVAGDYHVQLRLSWIEKAKQP